MTTHYLVMKVVDHEGLFIRKGIFTTLADAEKYVKSLTVLDTVNIYCIFYHDDEWVRK